MTVKDLVQLLEKRLEENEKEISNNIIFVYVGCPAFDGDELGCPCICVQEKIVDNNLSNKPRYKIKNMFKSSEFVSITCDNEKVSKKEECITFSKLIEVLKTIEDKEKDVYIETYTNSGQPQYIDIINVWPYVDKLFYNVSEYVKKTALRAVFFIHKHFFSTTVSTYKDRLQAEPLKGLPKT